jgi:hypothetical protein
MCIFVDNLNTFNTYSQKANLHRKIKAERNVFSEAKYVCILHKYCSRIKSSNSPAGKGGGGRVD